MNDDDPNWIENWFTALWAYNSGLHAYADRNSPDSGGYYGLGRLDNPANPTYPANRDGFLRDSYADAATPSHWSYPERIMGWIETPQLKSAPGYNGPAYHEPAYGENSPSAARGSLNLPLPVLNLPSIWAFCDAASGCSRAAGGCPAYHIIAHMPSHGGNWSSAVYNVQRGNQDAINGTPVYAYVSSCSIDQDPSTGDFGSDHWVDIGSYQLEPGAQVVLNNDAAPATADVGYDAMAFVPVTRQPGKGSCGTVYN